MKKTVTIELEEYNKLIELVKNYEQNKTTIIRGDIFYQTSIEVLSNEDAVKNLTCRVARLERELESKLSFWQKTDLL
jgi:hypothetical protein